MTEFRIKCIDRWSSSFKNGEVYDVVNGTVFGKMGETFGHGSYVNIDTINDRLNSQFELVVEKLNLIYVKLDVVGDKPYLFSVPKGVKLLLNTKVIVHTIKGNKIGTTIGCNFEMDEPTFEVLRTTIPCTHTLQPVIGLAVINYEIGEF